MKWENPVRIKPTTSAEQQKAKTFSIDLFLHPNPPTSYKRIERFANGRIFLTSTSYRKIKRFANGRIFIATSIGSRSFVATSCRRGSRTVNGNSY
jgi:hypothetical protein